MIDINSFNEITKAKKASPVGTEKTWGGKVYIKTANGWKPKGKGKSSKKDEQLEVKTAKVHPWTFAVRLSRYMPATGFRISMAYAIAALGHPCPKQETLTRQRFLNAVKTGWPAQGK